MRVFYDFHIHSCLSLCAEDDMTPSNIANMAALAGLQAIAVADHQSAKNCPAVIKAAERAGITAIPAMELCTREEVHVLCLFERVEAALEFTEYVSKRLMPVLKGKAGGFRQTVMDHEDKVLYEETDYLQTACDIGIYDTAGLISFYGGIAIPSHIDRPSFSLISNLGFYDGAMGFKICELSRYCNPESFIKDHPDLSGMKFITNSDAHSLEDIPDAVNYLEISKCSPGGIIKTLSNL